MAEEKKREIYTHTLPWPAYCFSWSNRVDRPFRLAVSSFQEVYRNNVQILELNENQSELKTSYSFDHPYPATKILWHPARDSNHPDLLATSGDFLRLWRVNENDVTMESLLNNNRQSEFCAPLTSFDWSEADPKTIGTSSIDTTCTIWNIETGQVTTQLIAHDKEVFDIAFGQNPALFGSVGADGSVRVFDLRQLDHSTIMYESPTQSPLLRLAWNKLDSNYMATFSVDSSKVILVDIRSPSAAVAELESHGASLNSICWAPHMPTYLCSAGDDRQALIWDLASLPSPIEDPILSFQADTEIEQIQWSSLQQDWVGITHGKSVQVLRV